MRLIQASGLRERGEEERGFRETEKDLRIEHALA